MVAERARREVRNALLWLLGSLDAAVWAVPLEVSNLRIDNTTGTTLTWTNPATGDVHDVAGGLVSLLRANGDLTDGDCLTDDAAGTSWDDTRPDPSAGDGWYYLVRAQNACGAGTYGYSSGGPERLPGNPCP